MQTTDRHRWRQEPVTSLILPTYNPGPAVEDSLRQLERFLDCAPGRWEILFICDGCTDGTPQRLVGWKRNQGALIRVLSYAANRGKGFAVRRGLAAARGTWRIFSDIDLAYGFDGVLRVAEHLWSGTAVAVASRAHPDSQIVAAPQLRTYGARRRLQSSVYSTLVRWLLPLRLRDTQAGLKGFSARAVDLLLPHLHCDGFAFDCELLMACRHHGLQPVEVPVAFRHQGAATTMNLRAMGLMLWDLWLMRRRWRRAPALMPLVAAALARQAAATVR